MEGNNSNSGQSSDQSSVAPEQEGHTTQTNNDLFEGVNIADTSWMNSGFQEMIRQRAHAIYAKFYQADNVTSDSMEQNMYETEESIVAAYGKERAMELLEPEIEFVENNIYGVHSVVPALLTTAASLLLLRKAPTFMRRRMGQYRSYPNSVGTTSTQGTYSSRSRYQLSQPTAGGSSRLSSTLRFVAEFTVSSMLGLAVFDYTIGPVEETDAPNIPLVEGISLTSMYKCPSYMSIYGSECQEGFWNNYKKVLASEEDQHLRKSLEYYEKWAVNCARRDVVERATKMALERGRRNQLAPSNNFDPKTRYTPVPPPGVPADLPVNRGNIGKRNM